MLFIAYVVDEMSNIQNILVNKTTN